MKREELAAKIQAQIHNYSESDLHLIATGLNFLAWATKGEINSKISMKTLDPYFSKHFYIDFNDRDKVYKVCKKYKGWKSNSDEI